MSKALSIAPVESTGTKVRRGLTRTLHLLGTTLDPIGAGLLLMVGLAGIFHVGPVGLQVEDGGLMVFALAVFGAVQALQYLITVVIDMADPDARDGDALQDAEQLVQQVRDDLESGADINSVLDNLQTSQLSTTLADLVRVLAEHHHEGDTSQGVWDPPLHGARWSLLAAEECIERA